MSSTDFKELTLDYWVKRWDEKDTPWDDEEVNPDLIKVQDEMLFKENCRILFPLCGKTVDMKYLSDKNHSIVGIEFVSQSVIDFFKQHNITYQKTSDDVIDVYRGISSDVTIYCGDIFRVNGEILGKFDAIWDRGSFIAINPSDRQKYARLMRSLMTSQTRYYLQAVCYDQSQHRGPPFSVTDDHMKEVFGEDFEIQIREDPFENPKSAEVYKLSWWKDKKYLLRLKS